MIEITTVVRKIYLYFFLAIKPTSNPPKIRPTPIPPVAIGQLVRMELNIPPFSFVSFIFLSFLGILI